MLFSFRGAAREANQNLCDRLEDDSEPLLGFLGDEPRESLLDRLAGASFWPARPIKFSHLVLVIAVASAAILFPRIGVLVMLLAFPGDVTAIA
ncbi:MAG: hypothetical protein MK180_16390 [Rhodobacteraceae bacterium]|nr:hypothetical protein [Paracoccaceae bacterium]